MSDVHDASYYGKCMIGGILACGLTHTAIVPLDVMKCKKQIDPTFCKGMLDGVSKVKANGQVTLGWAPTLLGYSLQGFGKFGFYEIFKDVYKNIVGAENADKYKKIGWSVASGSAEVIADTLLCPWEAVKLKIQLSRPGHEYPNSLFGAFNKIKAEEGIFCLTKVSEECTRVLAPFGLDKSPTPLSSLSLSNGLCSSSMTMSSLREKKITTKPPNLESPSPQDILQVSSVPLSLIPLTPWSPNCTQRAVKPDPSEKKSAEFTDKSVSKGYGLDL